MEQAKLSDKNKTLSSQVLEYYKKYSQNRELPKYFSGASTSSFKIEDWYELIKEEPPIATVCASRSLQKQDVAVCVTSPTNSIASNRKLEWDNGADIGYNNVMIDNNSRTLKKSSSLPILTFTKANKDYVIKDSKKLDAECCSSDTSTSESFKYNFKTSSSDGHDNDLFSDSESICRIKSLSTNSNKIENPIAESTPIFKTQVLNLESPFNINDKNTQKVDAAKKWHSHLDLHMIDQVSLYKNMKVLKLSLAKPIVVECVGVCESSKGQDKMMQTTLPRNPSVAIQTDFNFTDCVTKDPSMKQVERQSILYIRHSDSDMGRSTSHSGTATQTSSDALSRCNSFEYLSVGDYNKQIKTKNKIKNFNTNLPKSDISSGTASEISSTSTNNSKSLEKKLSLLKKVIKSKKHDNATKKYCLKKILETILDCEYSDHSLETINSNKEEVEGIKIDTKNIINLPAVLVDSEKENISQNLQTDIFIHEIPPILDIQDALDENLEKCRLQRSPILTLTTKKKEEIDDIDVKHDHGDFISLPSNTLYDTIQHSSPTTINTKSSTGSTADKVVKNWRKDKTQSEKLLEEKSTSNNKDLQENQLYWINNEISHLHKLKNLIENQNSTQIENILQEPYVEDMKGLKKTTTLYVITTEKSSQVIKCKCNLNKLKCNPKTCKNPTCEGRYIKPATIGIESMDDFKCGRKNKEDMTCNLKPGSSLRCIAKTDGNTKQQCSCQSKYICQLFTWAVNESKKSTVDSRKSCKFKKYSFLPEENTDTVQSCSCKCKPQPSIHPEYHTFIKRYTSDTPSTKQSCSEKTQKCISKKDDGKYHTSTNCNFDTIDKDTCTKKEEGCFKTTQTCRFKKDNGKSHTSTNCNFDITVNKGTCTEKESCSKNTQAYGSKKYDSKCHTSTSCNFDTIDKGTCTKQKSCSENIQTCESKKYDSKCHTSTNCDFGTIDKDTCTKKEEVCFKNTQTWRPKKDDSKSQTLINCNCDTIDKGTCTKKESCSKNTQTCVSRKNDSKCDTGINCTSYVPIDKYTSTKQSCCNKKCGTLINCTANTPTDNSTSTKQESCNKNAQLYVFKTTSCTNTSMPNSDVSSTSSDSTTSLSATQLCNCCKRSRKNFCKSSSKTGTKNVLCSPCYTNNGTNQNYLNPGHTCTCYNREKDIIQQIQNTIQQLQDLEKEEEYCKCSLDKTNSSSRCKNCGCKIQKKKKGGLAYVITLDSDESVTIKRDQKSQKKHHKKNKYLKNLTLQEYLHSNKPEFIASAEKRRQCMLDLAYMREKRCQKYKQLLALTNGIPCKNIDKTNPSEKQHVFTCKQMKQMTARHYKKLPEVQQKLEANRKWQIRKANRMLAGLFNKRLQQRVLKGNLSVPTDASVIKLV